MGQEIASDKLIKFRFAGRKCGLERKQESRKQMGVEICHHIQQEAVQSKRWITKPCYRV